MNFAVIGTGYWGSNHARVACELRSEGIVDEVVLCDRDEERVSTLAAEYDVEYVTDHRDLESQVDAVVVATPSTTHASVATDLLESGIDCLVEKPLALTSDSAWEIVETARQTNRTLAVGHIFRYHPALQELKSRLDRGELGQIKYLNTNRFSFRVPRQTSGVLHQLAVHDIDIYRYLLDEYPDRVYCNLSSWIRDDIDETAALVLDYGETVGTINESWQVPVFGKQRELVAVGTERAAYLDYLEDTVLELYDARIEQSGDDMHAIKEGSMTYEADPCEPLRAEVLDFVDSIRTNTTPLASGDIGANAVELLEIAQESDRTGRAISVERPLRG